MINNARLMMDKLGIWISGLCALHCIALPIVLSIAPLMADSFVAAEWFEHSILSLSMLIGLSALLIGYFRYHKQFYPIIALIIGGIIYWQKDIFGHAFEPITIALGASLIIAAHLVNLRLCRACKECDDDCPHQIAPSTRF